MTLKEAFPPVKYLCWICTSFKNKTLKYKLSFFSHFQQYTVDQVLKSFSGKNNSLESHFFGFSNSVPYGLEESRVVNLD